MEAHYRLGQMHHGGKGLEKDVEKGVYHFEKAAIGGHLDARMHLGYLEGLDGRVERAVKHFIIAAKLGSAKAMEGLWEAFKDGNITKEDLDATLRAHQAAVVAMKSEQRDFAEIINR